MKKLLPYLRLVMFCVVVFGAGGVIVLLKQGRLLKKAHEDKDGKTEAAAGENGAKPKDGGDEMKADLASGVDAAKAGAPSGGAKSGAPATTPSTPEEAKRQQAVATGRALFQVPEPISIAEASELLADLRRQKKEFEDRKAALDQREKELDGMEKELESRRNELTKLAEEIHAAVPVDGAKNPADEIDPATIAKLGKILEGTTPDAAARMISTYTPERAAKVLLAMKESKAAAVLGQIKDDNGLLTRITDALLKAKSASGGG